MSRSVVADIFCSAVTINTHTSTRASFVKMPHSDFRAGIKSIMLPKGPQTTRTHSNRLRYLVTSLGCTITVRCVCAACATCVILSHARSAAFGVSQPPAYNKTKCVKIFGVWCMCVYGANANTRLGMKSTCVYSLYRSTPAHSTRSNKNVS